MLKERNTLSQNRSRTNIDCYHCGLPCENTRIEFDEKSFCCVGCRTVYELLAENDLCQYYDFNETPGNSPLSEIESTRYEYLEDATVQKQLLDYRDEKLARVRFFIPGMHCSSCIWLLENLATLTGGVLASRVDFLRKSLSVSFDPAIISLRQLVEMLTKIGYEPQIRLENLSRKAEEKSQRSLYLKIGVAGFAFGNIMLLSFPEYLDIGDTLEARFQHFFGALNILLALPVLLYSAVDYFRSAFIGLKHRTINIDVPLSIGMAVLFFRSLYDIINGSGAGYMDSFAGLVFLLLIGKLFQQKTYDTLSFERDYKSFFPISVTRKEAAGEKGIPLSRLQVGDRIIVRNQELIPADAILMNGEGIIDYSFVTGESAPVEKVSGEVIYAGGRQAGSAIELEVIKEVSQSYLTQLWNNAAFSKEKESAITTFANGISKYFTIGIILVALAALIYWLPQDSTLAWNAFTAVLIIACPCALALSTPFTLGNVLRILGRAGFFLKNTIVIETLAKINAIVLDKTGTITHSGNSAVAYHPVGEEAPLRNDEKAFVKSLTKNSTHPVSVRIANSLNGTIEQPVNHFREFTGRGIEGVIGGHLLRLGNDEFVYGTSLPESDSAPRAFLSIDGTVKGVFRLANDYRPGIQALAERLRRRFRLALLSGDHDGERLRLQELFGRKMPMHFRQAPADKLNYIRGMQGEEEKVLMIGDGLNDAGALQQSDAGIAIAEDLNNFFPACDAILQAGQLTRLDRFLRFTRAAMNIIKMNFGISLLYNIVGLSFAVQGTLSPLICAILMPLSSITVILIATGATNGLARKWQIDAPWKAELKASLVSRQPQRNATVQLEETQ